MIRSRKGPVYGLILMLLFPAQIHAAGAMTVSIVAPGQGMPSGTVLQVKAAVSGSTDVKGVTARVGEREAPLTKTCIYAQCHWTGPLSLEGLPKGAKELSVRAEDTGGRSTEARQSFVYDEPPQLKVTGPSSGYVTRDGLFLVTAEASDDTGQPALTVKVTEYQSGLVLGSFQGGTKVSQEFDARAFDGRKLEIHVSADDGKGNVVKETRIVHVEMSPYLSEVEQVPGEIADFDDSRILYTAGDGSLRIRQRGGTEDTVVFAQPGRTTLEQKLVPGGAVFSLYRAGSFSDQELYLWQGGKLTPLASGASVRSAAWRAVSGKHAVYDEFPLSQTYYLDTETGERQVIGSSIYHADITPEGHLVFFDTDGIYRFAPDTGTRTLLLGFDGWESYEYSNPVADGDRLLFSYHSNISKFDGGAVTELSPPYTDEEIERGAEVVPYRDYQANQGWIAYTKGDETGRAIYLESPDGEVREAANVGGHPALGRLTEKGTFSFYYNGRLYLAGPQTEPVAVASSRGKDAYRGGAFYKALGDTLFRISTKLDKLPPVWPEEAALTVTDVTYDHVRLQWQGAEDDSGEPLTYSIYRDGELLTAAADPAAGYVAEGLEPGRTYSFSVEARDGAGNRSLDNPQVSVTTSQRPFVTEPPKVELVAPLFEEVVRSGGLQVKGAVSDDRGQPAVSIRLHIEGLKPVDIPAAGGAQVDQTLDLSAYEGQRVEVEVTAVDDEGQTVSVRRPVHVESGRALVMEAEADGRIVGFDQERLLFIRSDGTLVLRSRAGGEDIPVFADPEAVTDEHTLTPDGVLFSAYASGSGEPKGLYLWRQGKLTELTAGVRADEGWWLLRQREHAVFAAVEENRNAYYHLNTRTGAVTPIAVNGLSGADADASGGLILSDGTGLYTFRADSRALEPLLLPPDGKRYEQPEWEGGRLLYTSGGAIVQYDGTSSTVLSPAGAEGERLDGAVDYEAAGGWTAFTRSMGDAAGSRQIFLRSPDGTVTQATSYEDHGHPRISGLAADGTLTFYSDRNELYVLSPKGAAQRLASGDGVDGLRDGTFYKAVGRTLFRLETGSGGTRPPVWPAGEALTVSGVTYDSALLQWQAAAAQGGVQAYTIYRDGEPLGTVGAAVYTYKATGLAAGRTYTFSIAATDRSGLVSADNPSVKVSTPGAPVPAGGTVTLQAKPGFLHAGSELELRLRARDAADLRGFLLKLDYDRSRFKLNHIFLHPEFGTENKTVQLSKYLSTPGRIGLKGTLLEPKPPISGSPGLITLRFTVLQPGEGTFTLAGGSVFTDSRGALHPVPTPVTLTVYADSADLNGDGRTDKEDTALISSHLGTSAGQAGYDSRLDLNHDGRIDAKDLQHAEALAAAGEAGSKPASS
ncbi:fibronectin type III domain-containing protein [Paenibacillus mucilaginosus]|uniref:Fibronectin type-III domain-containing protein n=1 Tax=Paenibacillus mucilaginosus (strain KNP414) TaxID=1036673 RepID=F8FPV1_PAEMK|nr:fibronectin type III domain-containing protein [Paenibacillus mucilaginosus]AEI45918.1 hypothetical protein KNP414_07414 [Paenibacillus mucilaginosus KNP414]MCG7216781.1 fibronectin type III domain-containing protein [Paenibacillus mucilaginosus]WDM27273.1 fibronectin type III domain-containing protein [Paenibacillus mucilaginosus]